MAKSNLKKSYEQMLASRWWVQFGLSLVFVSISYVFISLAINSGELWQYAVGIVFFVWGVRYFVFALKRAFSKS